MPKRLRNQPKYLTPDQLNVNGNEFVGMDPGYAGDFTVIVTGRRVGGRIFIDTIERLKGKKSPTR